MSRWFTVITAHRTANAWVNLFKEFPGDNGAEGGYERALRNAVLGKALEGDADCGGLLAYGYFSGEHVTGFEEGRPLFVRTPDAKFNLANFMRVNLFTALGAIKIGMDILFKQENLTLDELLGHGGLFKTEGVGQKVVAAAVNVPVSVMKTAGEGRRMGHCRACELHDEKGCGRVSERISGKQGVCRRGVCAHGAGCGGRGWFRDLYRAVQERACNRGARQLIICRAKPVLSW